MPNVNELFARAGDAGERRQPALRDFDSNVLEVVLSGAVYAAQSMAVGNVRLRPLFVRPRSHHVGSGAALQASSDVRGLWRRLQESIFISRRIPKRGIDAVSAIAGRTGEFDSFRLQLFI